MYKVVLPHGVITKMTFLILTKRLPEMDGSLTDTKKQAAFKQTAVFGKATVAKNFTEIDAN